MSTAVLELMIQTAAKASKVILETYGTQFAVDYKSPADPVTRADREANELICRELSQAFPRIPIVAEESDPSTFDGYRSSERIFFVDPLDGTREFVARNGEFVVMIGLVDGDRATHGVVHAPSSDVVWAAELGKGAWRIERNGVRQAISPSTISEPHQARVLISRSQPSASLERALTHLGAKNLVSLGSAGLKAAAVSEGTGDAYVALGTSGKRWDVCGPDALVSAAGGCFTDAQGRAFDYRSEDLTNSAGILTANGQLHAELLHALTPKVHS